MRFDRTPCSHGSVAKRLTAEEVRLAVFAGIRTGLGVLFAAFGARATSRGLFRNGFTDA